MVCMQGRERSISLVLQAYDDAIRMLEKGDIFGATKKIWRAIEDSRNAFLVAIGVAESKAGATDFGEVVFINILRKLGRRDLIDMYYGFDCYFHLEGLHEPQAYLDALSEKIYEAKEWISEIFNLIDVAKHMEMEKTIKIIEEVLS